ncbi:MAG TPA: BON domain-containing protein [Gemmatimonadota bacterium]|nr:BON domain-containing protein [Gemmatimonadota bacterium]
MRFHGSIPAIAVLVAALACAGEDADEASVADTTAQDDVLRVPDSIIDRELAARFEADPRLAGEGIDVTARAEDGNVWLNGSVPTRYEMSVARDVVLSTPGVRDVYLDSLVVESDVRPEEEEEGS